MHGNDTLVDLDCTEPNLVSTPLCQNVCVWRLDSKNLNIF